mmetsp:Transcript_1931/g.5092  ORF Transcript_1931/g.5092 Transcript_1931/m.5092 type:complete len:201 (-) Transcript_1931:749-1351(-)
MHCTSRGSTRWQQPASAAYLCIDGRIFPKDPPARLRPLASPLAASLSPQRRRRGPTVSYLPSPSSGACGSTPWRRLRGHWRRRQRTRHRRNLLVLCAHCFRGRRSPLGGASWGRASPPSLRRRRPRRQQSGTASGGRRGSWGGRGRSRSSTHGWRRIQCPVSPQRPAGGLMSGLELVGPPSWSAAPGTEGSARTGARRLG